jgi:hypothetical protein
MRIKRSNLLLLGFYLTLLCCFVVYLVNAKKFIDEKSFRIGSGEEMFGPKLQVIDSRINHLVLKEGLYLQGIMVGKETKISYFENGNQDLEEACKVSGDTLFLNNVISILSLQIAHKLKSIRFENCRTSFSTNILEQNASVFILGGSDEHELYCEGDNLSTLDLHLAGAELRFSSMDEDSNLTIDTLRIELNNAEIKLDTEMDRSIGSFVVKSNYERDRVSASLVLLERMKLTRKTSVEIKF